MFLDHSWDEAEDDQPMRASQNTATVEGGGMGAVPGGTSELSQRAVVLAGSGAKDLVLFMHIYRLCCF